MGTCYFALDMKKGQVCLSPLFYLVHYGAVPTALASDCEM